MQKQASSIEVVQTLDNLKQNIFEGTTREKTAEDLFTLASRVAYGDDEDEGEVNPENEAIQWLNENTTPVSKKGSKTYWWFKPHNLMLNQALFSYNLWMFSVVPRAWTLMKKSIVIRDKDEKPEGVVIQPSWSPLRNDYKTIDVDMVRRFKGAASKAKSIKDSVKQQILDAAKGDDVSKVLSQVLPGIEKVALRRMTAKGEAKQMFYPIDGGKPERW